LIRSTTGADALGLGARNVAAVAKTIDTRSLSSRLLDGRFALTWLFAAYKRRPLNDRRWAKPESERNTCSAAMWSSQAPTSTNAAQTLSIIA